jgi:Mitochondrial small ribosomal subunit Rsm22
MFIEPQSSLKQLGDAIIELSDYFIDLPNAETPWDKPFCKLAYRHYYFPLNFIRNNQVIQRGQEVDFFKNIHHTVDWGAGPGTASLALAQNLKLKSQVLIEKSNSAINNFSDIYNQLINHSVHSQMDIKKLNIDFKQSLLVCSYSLTESNALPNGWTHFEALMILEPSTKDDGRKLLELRNQLIQNGYTLWAPCLHQKKCPLLELSKHDWCHDRFHVQAPEWFKKLEHFLPFKNNTITTSYLLARKEKPTFNVENKIRLTGDSMKEKGKTRQLICRGEDREFLTWMHKEIDPEIFPRGDLMSLPENIELKSNEIRVKKTIF